MTASMMGLVSGLPWQRRWIQTAIWKATSVSSSPSRGLAER